MTRSLPVREPPPYQPTGDGQDVPSTSQSENKKQKQAKRAANKSGNQQKRIVGSRKVPLGANRSYDSFKAKDFAQPFCNFLSSNPTVFHAVDAFSQQLTAAGFTKLSEREPWKLEKGGKYFVERNGSSLIAFVVGYAYAPGNGVAMVAGHVDALTAKVKPIPKIRKEGYVQLGKIAESSLEMCLTSAGVAPYAGALNNTWWDRDLGIAGRVLVKDESGKVQTKLVNIDQPSKFFLHDQ